MRATSSAVSLTAHVAIGAAVVLGTTNARPSTNQRPRQVTIIVPPREPAPGARIPAGPSIGSPVVHVPGISLPVPLPQGGAALAPLSPFSPNLATPLSGGGADTWSGLFDERVPEKLAGPLPVYPELLRQAGIEGRVVLEAMVDSTGRVDPASVGVVSATHPGFVAPAREALVATLFRPARVDGRAVRVPVRIPFDFTLRGGRHPR